MKTDFIPALSQAIDQFKGWETGWTSENRKQMIIWLEGVPYKITAEEVEGTDKQLVDSLRNGEVQRGRD